MIVRTTGIGCARRLIDMWSVAYTFHTLVRMARMSRQAVQAVRRHWITNGMVRLPILVDKNRV